MSAKRLLILPVVFWLSHSLAAEAQSASVTPQPAQLDAPASYWDSTVPVPRRALELTLSTALVVGLGQRTDKANQHVSETVDSGTSFQLGLGYRASDAWTLGVTTAYEPYDKGPADSAAKTEGAVACLAATYHFNPSSRMASWLQAGTGYRWLHEDGSDAGQHDFHGFQPLSLATGSDLRVAPRVAFGPALGAGLNALLWDGSHQSANQHLSVFWYLGVQARVDFAGRELNVTQTAFR